MKNIQLLSVKKNILYFMLLFLLSGFFLSFNACNPSSEDSSSKIPTGLHPVLPPFGSEYHGANYRFPAANCDEAQCHGSNLTGGNSGSPSCYKCHNELWNVFVISHTESSGGKYHHYNVKESSDYKTNCGISGCHGNYSLSTGTGDFYLNNQPGYDYRYSCYACHNPIP